MAKLGLENIAKVNIKLRKDHTVHTAAIRRHPFKRLRHPKAWLITTTMALVREKWRGTSVARQFFVNNAPAVSQNAH